MIDNAAPAGYYMNRVVAEFVMVRAGVTALVY